MLSRKWYRPGNCVTSRGGGSFEFAYAMSTGTNNLVEYQTTINGLRLLREAKASTIEIIKDYLLVLNQLAGKYECKDDILRGCNKECFRILQGFQNVTFRHILREQNEKAHDLA
jgi:ribonuclease HI